MNTKAPIQLSRLHRNDIKPGQTYRPAPPLIEVSADEIKLPHMTLTRTDGVCTNARMSGGHGGGIERAEISQEAFEALKRDALASIQAITDTASRHFSDPEEDTP